jgi:uncharacterized protein DUF6445
MKNLPYRRFILAVDDFYAEPDAVRGRALELRYYEPRWLTGLRSRRAYYPPDTRARLESMIGLQVVSWEDDSETGHGVFYKTFGAGSRKEVPAVHYDEPLDNITGLVYLTPGLPVTCGTSLWMHKETGLTDAPTTVAARRLGVTVRRLNHMLKRDAEDATRWIEIDRIGYRYNRLVCYPSGILHSATRHYGSSDGKVRLYQTFRFRVCSNERTTDFQEMRTDQLAQRNKRIYSEEVS